MVKFRKLEPSQVHIGRGKVAAAERSQFVDAIKDVDAGRIDLGPKDSPVTVKRRLREASQELGFSLRSAWIDESQETLVWKRTGF
jgi:hypothetical protein